MSRVCNIIVAGGSGSRFGADIPKQFCLLCSKPVLMFAIDALRAAIPNAKEILALHPDYIDYWLHLCREYDYVSPIVVEGGSTRSESVRNALALVDSEIDIISVHDGARPLVSAEMVRRVISAVEHGAAGVVPAVPVTDSLRHVSDVGWLAVDRTQYRAVQTPQAFRAQILIEAYRSLSSSMYTDDASVVEHSGLGNIEMVEGDIQNIKITNPYDIGIAEIMLRERSAHV